MEKFIKSFEWGGKQGVSPLLLRASASAAQIPQGFFRIICPLWILDYEFADYGKYRVKTANAPWQKRHGLTAHLYPPNTPFWEDTRGTAGRRRSAWIVFSASAHSDIENLIRKSGYARFVDPEKRLGNNLMRCVQIGEQCGEQGFWEAQSILCSMLNMLVNAQAADGETYEIAGEAPLKEEFVFAKEVENFLKRHISEKVILSDIAEHLHVCVSLLLRRYKAETGASPMATLIRLRVDYAKTLLLKGYPLKTIAGQLGFSDAFHFSKTFKRIEGISPRDFIETIRKN